MDMGHWLTGTLSLPEKPGSEFAGRLARDERLVVPGVFSPLVARLARAKGFDVLYVSGAAFSAQMGFPDIGLFTLSELAAFVRQVFQASGALLIVDVDTGFGEVLNAVRTARELVRAGAAAVQIEDQEMPKKCGHLKGKRLVAPEQMVQKIRAIRSVEPDIVVVARTDARSVEGFDEAVARARMYVDAGAHVIFPEALQSEEEFRRFAEAVRATHSEVALLANMTEFGRSPLLSADRLFALGYSIVIFPVTLLRIAMRTVGEALDVLRAEGSQQALLQRMQTRAELYELLAYDSFTALDVRVAHGLERAEEEGRSASLERSTVSRER